MSTIFPLTVGYELSTMQPTLLENNTGTPFITSDQPAVNLKANYNGTPPEELELYYPTSPKVALILTDGNKTSSLSEIFGEKDVIKLNNAIVRASLEQIYANEDDVLKNYISVGS